jgi:hypothetical protein
MTKRYWMGTALLAALGCLAVVLSFPVAAPADNQKEGDVPAVKPDPNADDVYNLSRALDMAEEAHRNKSAERLVAAALILRSINTQPGTEKHKVEGGTEGKPEPLILKDVADKLLEDARKEAAGKKKENAIKALADTVAKMEPSRGALIGPRTYYHAPGAGAADKDRRGLIHWTALDYYVVKRVTELTEGRQNPATAKPSTIRSFPLSKP